MPPEELVSDAGSCDSMPVSVRTFSHWELRVINEQFYAFLLIRVRCGCAAFWDLCPEPIAGSAHGPLAPHLDL